MRSIHSLDCDKCITHTFTEMSQLCEHQKEVHGVENSSNISQCDECDKSYETRNGLAIHKSVVHGKTLVKIFGCQPCDIKKFENPDEMNKHMIEKHKKTTIEDQKYKCEKCLIKFCEGEIFDWHCLYTHKIEQWTCTLCDKTLSTSSKKNHMSHTHGDKSWKRDRKTESCSLCDWQGWL